MALLRSHERLRVLLLGHSPRVFLGPRAPPFQLQIRSGNDEVVNEDLRDAVLIGVPETLGYPMSERRGLFGPLAV